MQLLVDVFRPVNKLQDALAHNKFPLVYIFASKYSVLFSFIASAFVFILDSFRLLFEKYSFLYLVHTMMGRLVNLASPPKNPHHLVHRQVGLTVTGPDQEPSVKF